MVVRGSQKVNRRSLVPCLFSPFSSLVSLRRSVPTTLPPRLPTPVPISPQVGASSYFFLEVEAAAGEAVVYAESGATVRYGGVQICSSWRVATRLEKT